MTTPVSSILMYFLASILGALGQYFYKWGAERAGGSLASYISDPWILAGVACYTGVMVLFVLAMKQGGSLSVLYPVYALTFVWAALFSSYFYGTQLRPIHICGMGLIILGMCFMGR